MIFKQIEEIKSGRKTMTQRIVGEGETAELNEAGEIIAVKDRHGRHKWRIGQLYAVVPKRGQSGIGRIRLLSIVQVSVRNMTAYDAWHEGVDSVEEYRALWNRINYRKGRRWEDNPRVWRLRFEWVK
jgi:hypothetical protein